MTSVKFFHSGMNGAPVLSGTAGALVGVLDACLKDGFGAKTITGLTVASGVATATVVAPHAAVIGSVVLVAGATPSGLNGEKRVTAITSTGISFATTEADGSASGTMSVKLAPLGFTTPFTGTNLRAYKSSSVLSTGALLRVDDTSSTVGRVVGYETMSDINTGTGPFPTNTQFGGGMYWPKSQAVDATARPWVVIGDDRAFVFYCAPNSFYSTNGPVFGFGDIVSNKSGDAYGAVLFGGASNITNDGSPIPGCMGYSPGSNPAFYGYVARDYTFLGGSSLVKKLSGGIGNGGYSGGSNSYGIVYPNGPDNALLVTPVELAVNTNLRGRFPGAFHTPQNVNGAFNTLDVVDGTGSYSGRKFMALRSGISGNSATNAMFMDITGPWR